MPTLNWIGKDAVIKYHKEVPFRLLKCRADLSVGDPDSGNLLVEGDNLEALKALLPYYAGLVKCIYIDPPYNTGNEGWVYNDNVNSPEIKNWLNKVVGGETEDLSRHDKWLCMMYPRLKLLHEMLRDDGVIFISIDDTELFFLKNVMDEIFDASNFKTCITWQRKYSVSNNFKGIATIVDYILVYSKTNQFQNNLLPRTEESIARYSNPDNDPRGDWKAVDYLNQASPEQRPNLCYPITNPNTGKVIKNTKKAWKYEPEVHETHVLENKLWWGVNGTNKVPALKLFLSEVRQGLTPHNWWSHEDAGHTDEAKKEIERILGGNSFNTPKPTRLIERILQIATNPGDIVLDSFAGSGTTGHAVLKSGNNRRFILIEMESKVANPITAERIKRAIKGYNKVAGLGGGFRFCELGVTLFDPNRQIREEVKYNDLAQHVYFIETGQPLPQNAKKNFPLLGISNGIAVYLLYNGILKDKSVNGGNVLTYEVLEGLPEHEGTKVVYGNGSRISNARLNDLGIVFKQIPYAIREM